MSQSRSTPSRREVLAGSMAVGLVGAIGCGSREERPLLNGAGNRDPTAGNGSIYERLLGVRPHLGAHEHVSRLGGGRMAPEVVEAMAEANEHFVDMHALARAAGKSIAERIGAEDALVTAGGFSAMVLGCAACLTGLDDERIESLPQVTWPRRRCLIPRGHEFEYDRAYAVAGAERVLVEDRAALEVALDERAALVAVLALAEKQTMFAPPLPVSLAESPPSEVLQATDVVEAAAPQGVPVLVDMASDLPPASNLTRFLEMGADLIVISGGKALRGPQGTGILAGRADLIEAARRHSAPNPNLGRGMKVSKESIVGLVVALERYLGLDQRAELESWNRRARELAELVSSRDGVQARAEINTMGYEDVVVEWDRERYPMTEDELKEALREGSPAVEYDLVVRTRLLRDDEVVQVGRRFNEVFAAAART